MEEALAQWPELEAKRERRQKGDGETARCSTTDPDARRRKMADGGYSSKPDIEELESHGRLVFTPVKAENQKRAKGQDPFAAPPGDSPPIAAWRQRMGTAAAQAL